MKIMYTHLFFSRRGGFKEDDEWKKSEMLEKLSGGCDGDTIFVGYIWVLMRSAAIQISLNTEQKVSLSNIIGYLFMP